MIRRALAVWPAVGLLAALAVAPAQAKQVIAMVDDAAARPATLAPERLHRLLLGGIEAGDRVHVLLATAAYGETPASLVTLIRFRAHARPAIRNAQLLATAEALAHWRRSEASHAAPAAPGSLAPLLIRTLREHARPAAALRLILAGRLTLAPPPDGAALRAALPSTTVVTAVDLAGAAATAANDDREAAEGDGSEDGAQAEGDGAPARSTLAAWRTTLAAAGARWQPAPWERP